MSKHNEHIASPMRRRFMEVSARYGFTVAVLATTGGYLWSDAAVAQTAASEEDLARKAQQQHVDECLRWALSGALANIDEFGIG